MWGRRTEVRSSAWAEIRFLVPTIGSLSTVWPTIATLWHMAKKNLRP